MFTVLIIILIVFALGGGAWGYRSGNWAAPGGLIAVILLIIVVLWLTGNLSSIR